MVISGDRIEKIIETVMKLETINNIGRLVSLLVVAKDSSGDN